jgi:hypothetical protein
VKAVALVALLATRAVADPTDRCISESETGQRLVLTRHFVEARQHLIACGGAACPTAVSADCIERLHQAEASAATVVVSAEGAERAFIDASAAPLGEAVWIDPGAHRVRFERGQDIVTANPIVAEGARLQRITAAFAASAASAAVVVDHPRAPIALAIAGGLSVVAGGVLGLVARSRRDDEQAACASPSACADHDAAQRAYDSASHYATASTITFAAGAALLAGAAVWWWRGATVIQPAVGPHDVGVAFVRAF